MVTLRLAPRHFAQARKACSAAVCLLGIQVVRAVYGQLRGPSSRRRTEKKKASAMVEGGHLESNQTLGGKPALTASAETQQRSVRQHRGCAHKRRCSPHEGASSHKNREFDSYLLKEILPGNILFLRLISYVTTIKCDLT